MAFHFNSPRLHKQSHRTELYDILRNARVYTTEGISSELHLSQGGILHSHVKERSELHIRLQDSQLEIFVPRDKKRQNFCYSSKLDSRLLEWLMTDPDTNIPEKPNAQALLTIQRLLNCTGSVLRDILEEDGIVTGDLDDLDDFEDSEYNEEDLEEAKQGEEDWEDEEDPEQDEHDNPAVPSVSRPIQSSPRLRQNESSLGYQVLRESRPSVEPREDIDSATTLQQVQQPDESIHNLEHVDFTRRGQFSEIAHSSPPFDLERLVPDMVVSSYPDLLRRVVTAARSARFPPKGIFDMSSMRAALQGTDSLEIDTNWVRFDSSTQSRATSTFQRLKEIGAAGELYVSAPSSRQPVRPETPKYTITAILGIFS